MLWCCPNLIEQLRPQCVYCFRGSIAYLRQLLSTLRAIISNDYARLAYWWLAKPYRTGLITCKETKRCFIKFIYLFAFKSPPHGLCTAQSIGNYHLLISLIILSSLLYVVDVKSEIEESTSSIFSDKYSFPVIFLFGISAIPEKEML